MASQIGLSTVSAVIAASASLSAEIDLGAQYLVGLYVPSNWTSANITFQVSPDEVNFGNMFSYLGAEVTFVAVAGQYLAVDPTLWKGARAIKVRSGTSGSPVNQTAQVTLQLVVSL
jgi:hypothetical protein